MYKALTRATPFPLFFFRYLFLYFFQRPLNHYTHCTFYTLGLHEHRQGIKIKSESPLGDLLMTRNTNGTLKHPYFTNSTLTSGPVGNVALTMPYSFFFFYFTIFKHNCCCRLIFTDAFLTAE